MKTSVRLNKYIADHGYASRRKADELISSGAVQVNGHTIIELGTQVHPTKDRVVVEGKPLRGQEEKVYILLNKPKNVLSTTMDPDGRPTVMDYLPKMKARLFPVGRLDWDSEGIILLTNDGDFANRVMHPRHEIAKTYLAKVNGQPTLSHLQRLTKGVTIPGGRVSALHVEKIMSRGSDQYDWVKIVIGEGKNRQIRHMFEKIGLDVIKLQRVAIGGLTIGRLRRGECMMLNSHQIRKIFMGFNLLNKDDRPRQKSLKSQSAKSNRLFLD